MKTRLSSLHHSTLRTISWIGLAFLLAMTGLSYWSSERYQQSSDWREHSADVLLELNKLKIALVVAESAQRGFIISGRETYTEAYHQARKEIATLIDRLKKLTSDNSHQTELIGQLTDLVEQRFLVLEQYSALIKAKDQVGMAEIMKTGRGQQLMDQVNALMDKFEAGENALLQDRMANADETFLFARSTVSVGLLVALVLFYFVTSLLRRQIVQQEIIEGELREARKSAQDASALKSSFLANMSHEIRTPLNGIVGMAKLLENTPLSGEQRDYLDTMKISSNSLLALINQILDFSKIESGKMQLEEAPFQLKSLVQGTISVVEYSASSKGLKLETHIEPEVPEFYLGDALRLRQVLLNLLNNAIKFSEKGTVRVNVSKIRAWDSRVSLLFEVSDEGIGLDGATKTKLFQAFSQGDESTSRKYGGSGLGLVISKQIVEMMDGSIGVESIEGKGSKFHFQVTLKISKFRHREDSEPSMAMKPKHLGANVLIAEDNRVNQKVVAEMMKLLGCTCRVVIDGRSVLRALQEEKFDLILMDGQMPEMDGYEATERIRLGEAGVESQHIPIIATTANAIKGDIEKCLASGMNDYIGKPISYDDLTYKVEKWLARGRNVIDSKSLQSVLDLSKAADPNLFKKLVVAFEQDTGDSLKKIKELLARKDFAGISKIAHAMKSSAANLGALRLRDISARIEKSKTDPHEDHISMLLVSAEREYQAALVELKRIVNRI